MKHSKQKALSGLCIILSFLWVSPSQAQQITKAEYFIDDDPGFGNATSISLTPGMDINHVAFDIDLNSLTNGVHQLIVRVQDEVGLWSISTSRPFYKDHVTDPLPTIVKAEYFVGDDPGFGKATDIPLMPGEDTGSSEFIPNLEGFDLGHYFFQVRVMDNEGNWSLTHSTPFSVTSSAFKFSVDKGDVFYSNQSQSATGYRWLFGDGQESVQVNPAHKFTTQGVFNTCLIAYHASGSDTLCLPVGIKGIQSVSPNHSGNTGQALLQITGYGFEEGSEAMLIGEGKSNIVALSSTYHDIAHMGTYFKLDNAPVGVYDLVITHPLQENDTLKNAFTIEAPQDFDPRIEIIGRNKILINRTYNYRIAYSNRGNVTAIGVPLYIEVTGDSEVALLNPVIEDNLPQEILDATPASHFYTIEDSVTLEVKQFCAIVIPAIAPDVTHYIDISIKSGNSNAFTIEANFGAPLYNETEITDIGLRTATSCTFLPTCFQCAMDLAGFVPGVGCITGGASLGCSIGNFVRRWVGNNYNRDDVADIVSNIGGTILSCLPGGKVADLDAVTIVLDAASKSTQIASSGVAGISSCSKCAKDPAGGFTKVYPVSALDPNLKTGPAGQTAENFIRGDNPIHYTIYFENADSATAPANEVFILDRLDTTALDYHTLTFTSFGFDDSLYTLNVETNHFTQDIDLRPAKNIILRVHAEFNEQKGLLSWTFSSFDAETMALTDDFEEGFLPPNKNKPEGEGFVSFSIKAKAGLPNLQLIENQADIIFDTNLPIKTPVWSNSIDKEAPESQVLQVQTITDTTYLVSWEGTDGQSGLYTYTIYVSENDGEFIPWLNSISKSSFTFVGQAKSKYSFYSVAYDWAGNVEEKVPTAEAETIGKVTGIEDRHGVELFKIYPNPTSDFTYIELEFEQVKQTQVSILNIWGKLIKQFQVSDNKRVMLLDMQAYPEGIYFIMVGTEKKRSVKKLMVKQ